MKKPMKLITMRKMRLKLLMKSGAEKKINVPSFWEWYSENSRETVTPYTTEEGREVYARLVEQKYDFPLWNK